MLSDDIPEWFCNNCGNITMSSNAPTCCNKEMVPFEGTDQQIHILKSHSNAWIKVWEKWKNHPRLREISTKLAEEGNYCAATHLNKFIEDLLIE